MKLETSPGHHQEERIARERFAVVVDEVTMELHQFEQAILKLAFETQSRITTASVAYYLGIPSREASRMLNALLEEGALELDSDENGNLFYRVPDQLGDGEKLKQLREAHAPMTEARPPIHVNATLDDDGGQAYSPVQHSLGVKASTDDVPIDRHHAIMAHPDARPNHAERDRWGGFDDYYGAPTSSGPDGAAGRRQVAKRVTPAWSAVASRSAATDGSVGSSNASRYLVQANARCEPQPLPSKRPVMANCDELPISQHQSAPDDRLFSRNQGSTALVSAQSTALTTELGQPEHQPGMALLLSLILCGTGQMYNGEISKGVMMMVLCFLLWFVLLGWVVHIWSIVDAVVVAERLNRKQA